MTSSRVLIVDDVPQNITLLSRALEPLGCEILTASGGDAALRLATRATPDLILLDVMMPGQDGYSVCEELKTDEDTSGIPVIFITARQETEAIVRGFKAGAVDYIHKPFQEREVICRVQTHLRISQLTRALHKKNEELAAQIARREAAENAKRRSDERLSGMAAMEAERWGIGGFVGRSRTLRRILTDIERLHQFGKTSVLITGDSGTGKELVARAIHHGSPRADAPFIAVNCVAIPSELAESQFFGHLKGSFTGALSDRKGCFELADGGTLFLDEIGDMPSGLQAKLLRVLEDGEITPVGAVHSRKVDVRVVAATNANLPEQIANGKFRQDLYFRLARFTVEMPPLRERREDIPLLAQHFLEVFAREMGIIPQSLTPEAMVILSSYSFPGNVRELKNVIERAVILSMGQVIEPRHLHLFSAPRTTEKPSAPTARAPIADDLPLNLDDAEKALIQRALDQTGGNVAEAARLLGVNRSRIYRRFGDAQPAS